MWGPIFEPGVSLLHGRSPHVRGFLQELAHTALHRDAGAVLWCDGDHGFDPYDFAELNLTRGFAADDGAERMLVKRCMTPFQWDTVLTRHLDEKLQETEVSLVIASPFDRLWSHEEIADWEQEDYTRFSLNHLRRTARRHRIPIILGIDMQRWLRTHPILAQITLQALPTRWHIDAPDGRWRATSQDGTVQDPYLRRQVTLLDFLETSEPLRLEQPVQLPVQIPRARSTPQLVSPAPTRRTRPLPP